MTNRPDYESDTVIDYIVQRLADEGITDCFGGPARPRVPGL